MNRYWPLLLVFAFGLSLVAGCAQQAVQTEAAKKEAAAQIAEKVTVDTSKLPPPRPALNAAPDLSGARYVIDDNALQRMSQDAVPNNVLTALNPLKGQEFTNSAAFAAAVKQAVGAGGESYLDTIMRDSLVIGLADEPTAPQGEVSLAEAEQRAAAMVPAEFGVVHFDFDRFDIKPEYESVISENAKRLLDDPNMKVMVEGNCDERGTTEYNLALGERRALAVKQALVAQGVSADRLTTISYGEERPVDPGHNEAAWAKNRRTVLAPQ